MAVADEKVLLFPSNTHNPFDLESEFLGLGLGILDLVNIELRPGDGRILIIRHLIDDINEPFVGGRVAVFAVGAFTDRDDFSPVFGGG